jgi:hypothetical protein
LRHPFVRTGLLLEHGCEQTHNDMVRGYLREQGVDPADYGWASIQLDGGIQNVGSKVAAWFDEQLGRLPPWPRTEVGVEALSLALTADGELPDHVATALAALSASVVGGGGTVVVPSSGPLARSAAFRDQLLQHPEDWHPTLAYGQPFERAGIHVMEAPTTHATETITGLGATGVQLVVAHVGGAPVHAHPMIPTLQVSGTGGAANVDLALEHAGGLTGSVAALEQLIGAVASRDYVPRLVDIGLFDFQLTRGPLGVSM